LEQPHTDTILVIDDDVDVARSFAKALQRVGYRVLIAHTAEDGLRLVHTERLAAIVLDLRMPFINGLGFLYRLRESAGHSDTPVLMVTGAEVDTTDQTELADLRAVVRHKPLGATELRAEIEALLRQQPEP
jgi:DNA-binding response OmpR family regulator